MKCEKVISYDTNKMYKNDLIYTINNLLVLNKFLKYV